MAYRLAKNANWDKQFKKLSSHSSKILELAKSKIEEISLNPLSGNSLSKVPRGYSVSFHGLDYRIAYAFYPCCSKPQFCAKNQFEGPCDGLIQFIKIASRENFYQERHSLLPDKL